MCMFFQKGFSVLSKRCVCSTAHVFMWLYMCLLVSMMFLSVFVMFLSSFCVLSFRTIVCYLLGRLIYAAYVPQQYLGLCPFWLLCINSSPSYGYCLLSKNNIHPQSKRMGRSSVFIINVANHGKNVSDSAGVNESAASSPEVGSGSSRGTARRLDWTCLFYRLHIVWSMLSNLPLCQTELTYELTWNLFLLCGVIYWWSECPNEEGESHRAGALLQIADLRSCINARAKSGNRHKKRKCGNDHLSGGRKGAAAMTERFLYVNRVLLLVVSMRRVRKSRTHISLMKYFGLQADKTFLMTLVKFRNKNWTLLESKKTPRIKSMEGSCGVFRVIVWTVRGHGVTMIGLGFHARAWDRLCCPYFGLMRHGRTNSMEQVIVGLEDLVPRMHPTSIFHRWHRWWQFRMQLRRAVSDSCGV